MKKLSLILVALLALLCLLPALADTATLPTVVPAESEDAFLGHWELSGAALFGMYMAADQLGVTASLDITSGVASLSFDGETYASPCSFQEDGTLQAVDSDGTISTFYMNDNGTVSVDVPYDEENTLTMYFSLVPEA